MRDEVLIGWLIFSSVSFDNDIAPAIPKPIQRALVARGWITIAEGVDWAGNLDVTITDAGLAICDLEGLEWGVDMIPEDAST